MARKNYPAKRGQNPHRGESIKKGKRKGQGRDQEYFDEVFSGPEGYPEEMPVPEKRILAPLRAITEAQGLYAASIVEKDITFGVGCAGTGKTFVALSLACEALERKETAKIIVSRPLVCTGEKIGSLPGELDQKIAPFFDAALRVFNKVLGKSYTAYLMKKGRIEFVPLELMTGYTFDDCWVVLDEAENSTAIQIKRFLTRLGSSAKAIVNGDTDQTDIRNGGLDDAVRRFKCFPDVGIIEFQEEDVVRSGIVKTVLKAYRN
jgi:phosphate starvation-inducible PhoH-like protein